MSILVKINNTQVLTFDITADDINITNLGNVSSSTPQYPEQSLCTSGNCYNCGTQHCSTTRCSTVRCTEVKCTEVKCNVTRCGYDSYCSSDN